MKNMKNMKKYIKFHTIFFYNHFRQIQLGCSRYKKMVNGNRGGCFSGAKTQFDVVVSRSASPTVLHLVAPQNPKLRLCPKNRQLISSFSVICIDVNVASTSGLAN
jgi:hypothetical protein